MSTGDDCLYAFIWQGHSMFEPLSEDAVRIQSVQDLVRSQLSLYHTWGGRLVGQTLVQLFVWWGKSLFNICNALLATFLVAEIYWCSNGGNINLNMKPGIVCWIFFALWFFAPGYSDVFFWLTGACIFLWPAFFLWGFLGITPFFYGLPPVFFFAPKTPPRGVFKPVFPPPERIFKGP